MDVALRWLKPADDDLLRAVIALADRNKRTLGPMPRGAFAEFAAQGTLLAATSSQGELLGYALFALALGRIRLIHLCVQESNRGSGVAGTLIDKISAMYPHLAGIKVRCRRDFEAHAIWPALGFTAVNEVEGRGKLKEPLTVWWKSHNLPDLFTPEEDAGALTVAIDHNVFLDLAVDRSRDGAAESQALEADWLAGQLRLCVTQETFNEITRLVRAPDRDRQRQSAARFPVLTSSPGAFGEASQRLRSALGTIPVEDQSDFRHVVYAAAGGASVFLSRDADWITTVRDAAAEVLNIRVLRPSDIVAHLEELAHAERYRAAALRGTGYTKQATRAGSEEELTRLLDKPGGERLVDYRRLLRRLAADPDTTTSEVRDPAGAIIAIWASSRGDEPPSITVPLLRHSEDNIARTVVRFVLAELKEAALHQGATSVRIIDTHVSPEVKLALSEAGFVVDSAGFRAEVLDVASAAQALATLGRNHPYSSELESVLAGRSTPARTASLERAMWPAKLYDSDLKSYIVPIQPRYARELFGLQDSLWDRAPLLGISREHVYYRSPLHTPETPSRVLWYASGSGRDRIGAVVACSQIVSAETDTPEALFHKFQHLGVYNLGDIHGRCSGGVATALRFVDTERLRRPVSFERLRALTRNRPIGSLQSPTMIDSEVFRHVYQEGVQRRGS